ncbi:unnamed protein product [Diatraea saccharalis]|uniref:Succinate dehydrogenase [ubiquinone] cytochrome b small subunit n=1 Tax=Diatraea saccharalis TaxID=40085 RepID=A0A9N9WG63_9NEOP|nr:unnamed protein product [Diatraea saccharalis]
MAFSMFLRNSVCTNLLRQQLAQIASQPTLTHRSVTSAISIRSVTLNDSKTPILNSVRSFRTTQVRLSDEKPHDHSKLWVIEKATSAALVPLVPLGLLIPNKIIDSVLAILITAHSFWGLEAIAVDYVRATIFGPLIPKIAIGLVYLLSIATLGGLFYLISHDVGLANSVKQIWSIKAEQKS